MDTNKKLMKDANTFLARMQAHYEKLLQQMDSSGDRDELENVGYAIQQMQEVADALECNT